MIYLKIAIDFDGTIVTHRYPEVGTPVPGAFEWMKKWQDAGATLYLWTMRDGQHLLDAIRFIESNGITMSGYNNLTDQKGWTQSPKLYAKIYVDDAAFGCPLITPVGERPYVDWFIVGPGVMKCF